jgi:hypothetical protein
MFLVAEFANANRMETSELTRQKPQASKWPEHVSQLSDFWLSAQQSSS